MGRNQFFFFIRLATCCSTPLAPPANAGLALCDGVELVERSALGEDVAPYYLLRQAEGYVAVGTLVHKTKVAFGQMQLKTLQNVRGG